jgi:hypothetical protein
MADQVYDASRGYEMGTFDPSLLVITMGEQSKNWSSITRGYISDVATALHRFIINLLQYICADERVLGGLIPLLMEGLLEQYRKAFTQVTFILQVELSKPMTQNHYFNDNLENGVFYNPYSLYILYRLRSRQKRLHGYHKIFLFIVSCP